MIRVGTCSFADEALTTTWYPKGVRTGEQRLRWYSTQFDTVEIDSSFYRLPAPESAAKWAGAVPDDFVFHVKAFAPMTRHSVRAEALPPEIRERAEPPNDRGRVDYMEREVRAEVFALFRESIEPIRAAGKLGGILLQMPPYFVFKPQSFEYLEWAKEQLDGDPPLIEFRHRSWLDEANRAETLSFLEQHGMATVVVDAPRLESKTVIPTVVAVTAPISYIRLHGRNAATWNVRGGSAAERFDYLYSEDELSEWVEPMRELDARAGQVFVLANTNNTSQRGGATIAQGPANAQALARILTDAGLPVSSPGS